MKPWQLLLLLGGVVLALGTSEGGVEVIEAGVNVLTGKAGFVQRLWAATDGRSLSFMTRVIIVAHAALESGWGSAPAARAGHNYWNLTAGSRWTGPVTEAGDQACDENGENCVPITQRFRKYDTDDDAVADYLSFIGPRTRYSAAYASLLAGDAASFSQNLHSAGYYTANVDGYTKSLVSLTGSVQGMVPSDQQEA